MPSYDLKCTACGRQWERWSTIAARHAPCDTCGGVVEQEFKPSAQATPFVPYFDIALGEEVGSFADRWRLMRQQRVQYRDKLSPGDLSARRDRIEQEQKELSRG
jgi:putative FmdB family regulatory protein